MKTKLYYIHSLVWERQQKSGTYPTNVYWACGI
jgi:hypothetical protein